MYICEFFLEWDVCEKVIEEIKTQTLSSVIFFPENRAVYEIMGKKRKMHCFGSTATMITRTPHYITLYVYCICCFPYMLADSFEARSRDHCCRGK